jgi:hypothetical protein
MRGQVALNLHHPFPDIFLIDDIIAVIHAVGFVARDLFGHLVGHSHSIHVARRRSPVVVHNLPRRPGLLPCGPPHPVVVLDAVPRVVEWKA